tara:strand:+ start:435 stop:821 length:387 start_codon:yes stop_codon:yes gene_type:complete
VGDGTMEAITITDRRIRTMALLMMITLTKLSTITTQIIKMILKMMDKQKPKSITEIRVQTTQTTGTGMMIMTGAHTKEAEEIEALEVIEQLEVEEGENREAEAIIEEEEIIEAEVTIKISEVEEEAIT